MLRIDPYSESFEALNPVVTNHYDEDIGFSETSFVFTLGSKEFLALEPSGLGYACIQIFSKEKLEETKDLLKANNIEFTEQDFYC